MGERYRKICIALFTGKENRNEQREHGIYTGLFSSCDLPLERGCLWNFDNVLKGEQDMDMETENKIEYLECKVKYLENKVTELENIITEARAVLHYLHFFEEDVDEILPTDGFDIDEFDWNYKAKGEKHE